MSSMFPCNLINMPRFYRFAIAMSEIIMAPVIDRPSVLLEDSTGVAQVNVKACIYCM